MSIVMRKMSLLSAACIILMSLTLVSATSADTRIPKPLEKPNSSNNSVVSSIAHTITALMKKSVPVPAHKPSVGTREYSSFPIINSSAPKGVFSDKQARLYREVFDLQGKGDITTADKKIGQLNNDLLLGHVLAERYLHPVADKASYQDLQKWMALYSDHPQAKRIYALAMERKPIRSKSVLSKPKVQKIISGNLASVSKRGKVYKHRKSRTASQNVRVKKLFHEVRKNVGRGSPTLALNILSSSYAVQFMDDVEYDRLRALIASGYLYAGKINKAYNLSNAALNRSGGHAPMAGWVKGLVEWQKKNYKNSARAFEATATSPYSSGWMVSAAAYWASRANMRAGNVSIVHQWLKLSATYPRTFYGLIATRALGRNSKFNWSIPSLTREHVKIIESTKKGARAAALVSIGRVDLAENELLNMHPERSVSKQQALLAYAHHYKLPALQMRLANAYASPKGLLYDAALYPVPAWEPARGYRVDKALIHAIVRQESRFRVSASNPSGATGLMQLMPSTANHVSGKNIYSDKNGQYQLKDPKVNLEIGQSYIEELLNHKSVGQDLLSLAMAYNAGPGNLSRWKRERSHIDDPLMFIETIPFSETRAFVERVLSNYWIYRMQMNQKTPTLDAVAHGKWARYVAQDNGGLFKFAEAGK